MKRRVNRFPDVFVSFLRDKCGATAIEYTLIASIICIGVLAGATSLGSTVDTVYTDLATNLSAAME